jgi:hypothetical protein
LPQQRTVRVRPYRQFARVRSLFLRIMRFIEGLLWGRDS